MLQSGKKKLATGAIRPTGIYGDYEMAQFGNNLETFAHTVTSFSDKNLDFVYIENLVHAHVLLAARLWERKAKCAGQAFQVYDTNCPSAKLMQQFFEIAQEKQLKFRSLPLFVFYMLAFASESFAFCKNLFKTVLYHVLQFLITILLCGSIKLEKPMTTVPAISKMFVTRTGVETVCSNNKISRVLGYKLKVEPEEAVRRTGLSYRKLIAEKNKDKKK